MINCISIAVTDPGADAPAERQGAKVAYFGASVCDLNANRIAATNLPRKDLS